MPQPYLPAIAFEIARDCGRFVRPSITALLLTVGCACTVGCGTTRWSDTPRTATEQMLLSDAIDRAITQLDFRALAGKDVFFDDQYLEGVVDRNYIVSSLRQHLLASGAYLRETREEATYVVEARAGAVGTDRHELLMGVPALSVPSFVPIAGMPSSIPEIPLMKETEQLAAAKVAVFAYNRKTGRPVWQSGIKPVQSQAEDTWVFGAGPFQQGAIYDGTHFAGNELDLPLVGSEHSSGTRRAPVSVRSEMTFPETAVPTEEGAVANSPSGVRPASSGQPIRLPPPSASSVGAVNEAGTTTPSRGLPRGLSGDPNERRPSEPSADKATESTARRGWLDFLVPNFGRK